MNINLNDSEVFTMRSALVAAEKSIIEVMHRLDPERNSAKIAVMKLRIERVRALRARL